ncbi:hypothetical protein RchiOBHm_Chr1g0342391 [Rosa chinensis]|uniref:Uncharacterized protein n=1 Tax=Rosa chinensis TaxID=74649 RepID=A0A2P6SE02_ROSCH|nr:hypothetical protein RchiOBHm_Chr1g0342391 [Rosa chinensis]
MDFGHFREAFLWYHSRKITFETHLPTDPYVNKQCQEPWMMHMMVKNGIDGSPV